jgi:hypothetical protein
MRPPTVSANFGPLSEVSPDPEVAAKPWSPEHFADAVERLLASVARRTLATGTEFMWAATAAVLVGAYRATLGLPSRS